MFFIIIIPLIRFYIFINEIQGLVIFNFMLQYFLEFIINGILDIIEIKIFNLISPFLLTSIHICIGDCLPSILFIFLKV
jgi:hypothetical protein